MDTTVPADEPAAPAAAPAAAPVEPCGESVVAPDASGALQPGPLKPGAADAAEPPAAPAAPAAEPVAAPALSSSAASCVGRSTLVSLPARPLDLRRLSCANHVNVFAVFPRPVSYVLDVLQRHASLVEAGGPSPCPWLGHPSLLLSIITIHSDIDVPRSEA